VPADISAGDICSIEAGDGLWGVVKVLAVDKDAVHIRPYKEKFSRRPQYALSGTLTLGTVHDTDGHGIGHLPLSLAAVRRLGARTYPA
jgi:hypothetical protein